MHRRSVFHRLCAAFAVLCCWTSSIGLADELPVIDGLQLQLDASALATPPTNSPVALWPDLSGKNHHAAATGAQAPTYQPAAVGGRPALRFDGVDDRLVVGAIRDALGGVEVFIVSAGPTAAGPSWQRLAAAWTGGPENEWVVPSWNMMRPNASGAPLVYPPTIFQYLRSSGVEIDNLVIGDGSKSVGSRLLGDIAEVIVYDRQLDTSERENVGWYLARKYGIATAYLGKPAIANLEPTMIAPTGATLNGRLGSQGDSPTTVTVYWGPADAGKTASAWASHYSFPAQDRPGVTRLSRQITGLAPGATVYYRFHAVNASGENWARATDSFNTSPPTISAADIVVAEGNRNSRLVSFIVTLSKSWAADVTVDYATADGAAVSPQDYVDTAGTLLIPAGQATGSIPVRILGDETSEGDESFDLILSNPAEATLADALATAVILDDDRTDYHVSLTGDDANPGTEAAPYATILRARDALRIAIAAGGLPPRGATVWLHHGDYLTTQTITLDARDSGTSTARVTWRAWPGDRVRILGSVPLQPAWFAPVTATSPVWPRLDAATQGNLLEVDLAAHGIADYGALAARGFGNSGPATGLELFFNEQPMQLGRWPNAGSHAFTANPTTAQSFAYTDTRPGRWTTAEALWCHGYYYHSWADYHVPATVDTANKLILLGYAPNYGVKAGQPWYAWNLLEEIDIPGEWYLNRDTGILYFWPPETLTGAEIRVSITANDLLLLDGASHITIRDIAFEENRARLVRINGGEDNMIYRCTLANCGTDGITVSGTANGVSRCVISGVGSRGVSLSGGDRLSLTKALNYVRDTWFHDFSRLVWTYTPAVAVSGVGLEVAHNLMHDAPHSAVIFSGNENMIEYNDIARVCIYTSDAGAVYTGRDWGARGNIERYNFIHEIASAFPGYGVHGIYLDDCVSGITVFGNVFYDISGYAIQHGGGRDDWMENNIIVKCGWGDRADARGPSRIMTDGGSWDLLYKIQQLHYQEEPWASAYPRLAAIPNNQAEAYNPANGWLYPEGSRFSRNIGYQNGVFMYQQNNAFSYYEEIADNLDGQDPLFVDEANLDLTLRPESPAYTIPGFTSIPFRKIGIRKGLIVETRPPIQITGGSAVLRGETIATGETAETAEAILYWGATDALSHAWDWPSSASLGQIGPEPFAWRAEGLAPGTTYYYRARLVNPEGSAWSATAGVFYTGTNAEPVARADSYQAQPGQTLQVPPPGILANDTDAQPLQALRIAQPAHGTLALNPDGSFDYTPADGFSGDDAFTYRATDGALESNTTIVTLHVSNDPSRPPAAARPVWTRY